MATSGEGKSDTDVQLDGTPYRPAGTLIIIGGHEQKEGTRPILELIAKRAGKGRLVVVTLASEEPEEQWQTYEATFKDLGVTHVEQLDSRGREDLLSKDPAEKLDEDSVIFFAGGDQLKITTKFGGTPLCDRMRDLYTRGALIAGTSSGASVMAEVAMAGGEGQSSHQSESTLQLAPGLGLISGVIIDQHFAERGRMGRLLAAVGQNPRLLGIGIDEDTALVVQGHERAAVVGSGAVYFVDGREVTHSQTAQEPEQAISLFGIKLHVLRTGDRFDLTNRQPSSGNVEDIERELVSPR